MAQIRVENLSFSYPNSFDPIFDHISFQIDTDWKLGFVGRNGRGKTTFLNLLMGKYEYQGKIISSVQFDYFPFQVNNKKQLTLFVLQEICPLAMEWEIMRELSYLDVKEEVLYQDYDTLSNGEQTKVLLAALFLNDDHFLLIDEPTNHLDQAARKQVGAYLKRKKGFILVSHDRQFLDDCVDHILSINRASIDVQSGNFSSWLANFNHQQQREQAQNEHLKKDIKRMQKAANRVSNWSDRVEASKIGAADKGFVGHKAAKLMKRSKAIEQRQEEAISKKATLLKNVEKVDPLKIQPLTYHANTFVSLKDVVIDYAGKKICDPISFTIEKGDRVFINGKNGSGKSSLLKLIHHYPMTYSGTVTIAGGLVISYVEQDTSHLSGSIKDFVNANQLDESLFKAILRKMDFDRVQFEKKIQDFSGGQKKKILIAKSLCEKTHLYIWDEPLNYIDIYSRMQIEQLILEYCPTMLLVEHDAMFCEKIATKVIEI